MKGVDSVMRRTKKGPVSQLIDHWNHVGFRSRPSINDMLNILVVFLPSSMYTYRSDSRPAEGREGQKGQIASFRQELATDCVLPAVRSRIARTVKRRLTSLAESYSLHRLYTMRTTHLPLSHAYIHTFLKREKKEHDTRP